MTECPFNMHRVVVEEVGGVLKYFSDGTVERPTAGNPLARHVPASNDSFVEGVATRDVVVEEETGAWVRIYLPEPAQKQKRRLPVVIHFHGGGFCVSHADWEMYHHFYTRLVRASGTLCVSVDYRLAPEHRLPAACDDCFGVLRWLRSDARDAWLSEYADFCRCFLIGDSAGGNLVHQMVLRSLAPATTAGGDDRLDPLCLRGCVLIHAGFVRAERSKSEAETPPEYNSPLLTVEIIDKFLKLALPVGSSKDHPITNPMGPQAPPVKGLRFPKMLVAIADRDLMRDTQREYCEAMEKAGQDVEVLVSENVGHCFHLNEIAFRTDPHTFRQTSVLLDALVRFFNSCEETENGS